MSKELEMLDQELKLLQQQKDNLLRKQARAKTDNETKYWQFRIDKFNEKINLFNYIKASLNRLKAIDNANPSDALEVVGYLKDHHLNAVPYYDWLNEIEQYILKAQEQEKENARNEEILQKYYREGITLDSVRALKQENAEYKKNIEYQQYSIDKSKEIINQFNDRLLEQEKENAELKSRIQDLEKDLEEQQELAKHYLEEQEKVLEILKPHLRLVDNYLQVKVDVLFNCWVVIKEITDEQEFDLLKRWLEK